MFESVEGFLVHLKGEILKFLTFFVPSESKEPIPPMLTYSPENFTKNMSGDICLWLHSFIDNGNVNNFMKVKKGH